jgi:hypothetical protein
MFPFLMKEALPNSCYPHVSLFLEQGGETEALRRLQLSMSDAAWVAAFEKPMVK